MKRKLAQRGYGGEAIDKAIARLRAEGILDERRMLESRVEYLVLTKKYGKRRVIAELLHMGFPRELVAGADFGRFDFAEICARLIERAGGLDEKLFASLLRRGYTPAEIRKAVDLVKAELI